MQNPPQRNLLFYFISLQKTLCKKRSNGRLAPQNSFPREYNYFKQKGLPLNSFVHATFGWRRVGFKTNSSSPSDPERMALCFVRVDEGVFRVKKGRNRSRWFVRLMQGCVVCLI